MNKKRNQFAVFMDVDGVLNTRTTIQRTPKGYIGIDDARVAVLARAIAKYGGGEIILTSDWKYMKSNDEDYIYLVSALEKQGLKIADRTQDCNQRRGAGIAAYLAEHAEVREYVILDDCTFDFMEYRKLWERLLLTNGIERARFASDTPAIEAILFMDYINFCEKEL